MPRHMASTARSPTEANGEEAQLKVLRHAILQGLEALSMKLKHPDAFEISNSFDLSYINC